MYRSRLVAARVASRRSEGLAPRLLARYRWRGGLFVWRGQVPIHQLHQCTSISCPFDLPPALILATSNECHVQSLKSGSYNSEVYPERMTLPAAPQSTASSSRWPSSVSS